MKRIAIAVTLVIGCGQPQKPTPTAPQPASHPAAKPPPKLNGAMMLDECDQVNGNADAAALYDKACTANDAESCDRLAALYMCGKGVGKDGRRSMELDARACELDYVTACGNVAMAVVTPDATIDQARAVKLAQKGCAAHDRLSCAGVGFMYLQGWGVAADPVKAAGIFDDLCTKQGYQLACANLAFLVYSGVGTAKDVERATALADSACKAKMPAACNTLGAILIERNGPGDARRAEGLFGDLCLAGAAAACDNLGQLYRNGLADVAVDLDKAKDAFDSACKGGNAPGCRHLADLISK